ncbi:MAG: peptidoglycan-associated lipoprotein Pal [Alphaproteobacteria bacterium]
MKLKLAALFSALLFVSGCQTSPTQTGGAGGTGFGTSGGGAGGSVVSTPQPGSQAALEQAAGDRVFFDFDRYNIDGEAEDTLKAQAAWLESNPSVTVTVEGHADERGTREYNLALGERRANAVKNYLVALGIDDGRITTISYGKERPAVEGSNEAAWAKNRRAVTVVTSSPRS